MRVRDLLVDEHSTTVSLQDWIRGSAITTPVYHQTHRDNVAPIRANGFDLNKIGARGCEDTLPDGVYFKPTDKNIGVGGTDDAVQMAFYIRLRNPLRVLDRETLLRRMNQDPEFAPLKKKSDDTDTRLARAYDKLEARQNAARKPGQRIATEFFPMMDKLFAQGERLGKRIAAECRRRCTAWLREQGYDGLIIQHDAGSFGRSTTTYVVLDTANIRAAE